LIISIELNGLLRVVGHRWCGSTGLLINLGNVQMGQCRKLVKSLICSLALLLGLLSPSLSQAVPDEAMRHFNRGMAAVEMAVSQDDYQLAVDEFRQALALAPDWAEARYNLGLVQEKAGNYRDAVNSLRRYLQLAPNAPDAAQVRTMADKLEFKADQFLSDEDVLDIYVSLTDQGLWQDRGRSKVNLFSHEGWVRSIRKTGSNALLISYSSGYCGDGAGGQRHMDQEARLTGKKIEFATITCYCDASQDEARCAVRKKYFLEVVSRNKVHVRMQFRQADIAGGGTDEDQFDFVRR